MRQWFQPVPWWHCEKAATPLRSSLVARTQLVGVETGEFSDGFVELLGDAVTPGTEVVVP